MKIYLSVNNGADILTVPVIPPEFTVQKPQGGSAFETISSGELNLIGTPKLKSISWSFLPHPRLLLPAGHFHEGV